jgi:hypothetical protein
MRRSLLVLALVLSYAGGLKAQTITQQPTSQTVQVGGTATFTASASSICRSWWVVAGVGKYDGVAATVSITIPNVTLGMNGEDVQVEFYNCAGSSTSLWSNHVKLFVVPSNTGPPSLTSVTPIKIATGSANTQLTLNGTNFSLPVVALLNENSYGMLVPLVTKLIDSQTLQAVVPAGLLKTPAVATVFALQGGQSQTVTQPLTITIGSVIPTLTGITPAHAVAGATSFTITLTGANFTPTSVVNWNSTPLATTLVSSTSVTANISQAMYAGLTGIQKVTVTDTAGTSAAINFTVVAPLVITTTTLPGGTIGTAYTATVVASGGVTPYAWTISTGTLPAGLSLNSTTGVISGTPTAAGSATFTLQVTDKTGTLARQVIGGKAKTVPPKKVSRLNYDKDTDILVRQYQGDYWYAVVPKKKPRNVDTQLNDAWSSYLPKKP